MTIQALNASAGIQSSLLSQTGGGSSSNSLLSSSSPTDILDISSEGQSLASGSSSGGQDLSYLASALPSLVSAENTTSLLSTISAPTSGSASFYNVLSAQNSVSTLSALNSQPTQAEADDTNDRDNSAQIQAAREVVDNIVSAVLPEEEVAETEAAEANTETDTSSDTEEV